MIGTGRKFTEAATVLWARQALSPHRGEGKTTRGVANYRLSLIKVLTDRSQPYLLGIYPTRAQAHNAQTVIHKRFTQDGDWFPVDFYIVQEDNGTWHLYAHSDYDHDVTLYEMDNPALRSPVPDAVVVATRVDTPPLSVTDRLPRVLYQGLVAYTILRLSGIKKPL
jgi:hypothetical protein